MKSFKPSAAFLVLAGLLSLPGHAWAQQGLILPRGEIGQVLAAQQLRNSQLKAFTEDYRQRLRAELRFVARACELSPEHVALLEEQSEAILQRAKEDFFDAFENQQPNRRIVIVNNRRVAVIDNQIVAVAGGATPEESPALKASMANEVDAAVRRALPAHIAARLTEERASIGDKAKHAKLRSLVAVMDEILLFSEKQREEMQALLESAFGPQWAAIVEGETSTTFPPVISNMMRAKLRGFGGGFDLPDTMLEPLLRPAQMAVWKELRKPLSPELLALQPELIQAADRRQLMFGAVVGGNARLRGNVILGEALQLRGVAANRRDQTQSEVEDRGDLAVKIPAEKTACLDLSLDALDEACRPSPEVCDKLRWAGKLDLYRYATRAAELQQELKTQLPPAGRSLAVRELARALAPDRLLMDDKSLFRKALDSRLSEEQLSLWRKRQVERRQFQRQARLQIHIFRFSQRAPMTAAQWNALAKLFSDRLNQLPQDALPGHPSAEVNAAIAQTPDDALKPLFDDTQWPAISRRLQELRQTP